MFVSSFVKSIIQPQIFDDIPVWVEDYVIVQALSYFGCVVGEIRHGFDRPSNGSQIGTGVRFRSFMKTAAIPSYVHADGKNVFRIRHESQITTCLQYGQKGHQAASFPTKPPWPAYPYAAALSGATRSPEANSQNQTKNVQTNSHSPNQDEQASEPVLNRFVYLPPQGVLNTNNSSSSKALPMPHLMILNTIFESLLPPLVQQQPLLQHQGGIEQSSRSPHKQQQQQPSQQPQLLSGSSVSDVNGIVGGHAQQRQQRNSVDFQTILPGTTL